MTWTLFWDMHSGGGTKEPPYEKIYIEAPRKEAEIIFYNRFGHSPIRVSCTCCGGDYSIDESESLEKASAYHRNCWTYQRKQYDEKLGWGYRTVEKAEAETMKVEDGFELRKGYGKYQTLEQYLKNEDILVIRKEEIKPEERQGEIPEQGYVWKD